MHVRRIRRYFHNEKLLTEAFFDGVLLNFFRPNSARLRRYVPRTTDIIILYHLDNLLSAMSEHAPHLLGRRHARRRVAHRKGEDGVVNAAKVRRHSQTTYFSPVRSFNSLSLTTSTD